MFGCARIGRALVGLNTQKHQNVVGIEAAYFGHWE